MNNTVLADRWPFAAEDPYPAWRRLRDAACVHWCDALGCHLVVSHAVGREVFQGSAWSCDPSRTTRLAVPLGIGTGGELLSRSVLFADPPAHTRLRAALRPWLTPRAMEGLRHRVAALVQAAVARGEGALEVMEAIAYPVPLAVVCELLDVPAELAERLREETPRIVALLDPLPDAEASSAALVAAFSLLVEILPLVAGRRANPGSDVLSGLMAGGPDEGGLGGDEAVMMALLLLAAGHETTANLIGNAVLALHAHPDAARSLRHHPHQIPAAIEELIRYESPVQLASRVAIRDTVVGGTVVPEGGQVLVSLGAANRDPTVYSDPDRFAIERRGGHHLGFGHGAHFCAGAALARVEAQEVLRHLLQLTPPIEEREVCFERGSSATFRRITYLLLR